MRPGPTPMRIFAGGIATESNSFALMPTTLEDFDVRRPGAPDGPGRLDLEALWGPLAASDGHELIAGPYAWANPSGITVRSAYETLRDELLKCLAAAGTVDVVLLMLHGAMLAEGYDDCERDLIDRVRNAVGPVTVVAVELDLHAHVSAATLAGADVAIAYKHYPHIDIKARAHELYRLAIGTRSGQIRPVMALADCRTVGQFPTTREPMQGFVEAMTAAERRPGVLSLSLIHGFRLGDVPHLGARMLAVSDGDPALAASLSSEFAARFAAIRGAASTASGSLGLEEALGAALRSEEKPVVVAEPADNPGSGAPGDATFALEWLVEHDAQATAIGLISDPEVVRVARRAGIGATLELRLGGKMGRTSGNPVDLVATVTALAEDYRLPFPQDDGSLVFYRAGDVAALRSGGIDILVGSVPVQCYSPAAFTDLGIDVAAKQLVVVKSAQHFRGAFNRLAARILLMSTAGAAPADPRLIAYRRFDPAGVFPWSEQAEPAAPERVGFLRR